MYPISPTKDLFNLYLNTDVPFGVLTSFTLSITFYLLTKHFYRTTKKVFKLFGCRNRADSVNNNFDKLVSSFTHYFLSANTYMSKEGRAFRDIVYGIIRHFAMNNNTYIILAYGATDQNKNIINISFST